MAWSWGAGSQGQLGHGSLDDSLLPRPVNGLESLVAIACGGAHVVAIVGGGEVAAWGRGQQDEDEDAVAADPRPLKFLRGYRICQVAAGWNHTAFVTETGELLMSGDGQFGQLGLGDFEGQSRPCKVENIGSVRLVACGMRHTVIVTGAAEVLAFGHGKRGQLGTRSLVRVCSPARVHSLDCHSIVYLAANGDHSGAVDCNGRLYLWGKSYNQGPDVHEPELVELDQVVHEVSLGWNHGLCLTVKGEVFSWGSNRYGQLGRPSASASDRMELFKVEGLDKRVVSVSCGAEHSAAVLESGEVVTWGWGEHGQLGLGRTTDESSPRKVFIDGVPHVSRAFCGGGFTIIVK